MSKIYNEFQIIVEIEEKDAILVFCSILKFLNFVYNRKCLAFLFLVFLKTFFFFETSLVLFLSLFLYLSIYLSLYKIQETLYCSVE